ncbi:hypothetical protein TSAR_008785, partial [Trichomalopsis sarcophagae]
SELLVILISISSFREAENIQKIYCPVETNISDKLCDSRAAFTAKFRAKQSRLVDIGMREKNETYVGGIGK